MRKALVICILSFHAFNASFSQNLTVLDSLKVRDFIDTLFIDRDINYWSIRLFTHLKSNWFGIMNSDQKISYVPNNLFGIGVGLGTRKLLLDIGFSPGGNQENVTHRIDLQTAFILKKHFLEAYLHRYQGYNVRSDLDMRKFFVKICAPCRPESIIFICLTPTIILLQQITQATLVKRKWQDHSRSEDFCFSETFGLIVPLLEVFSEMTLMKKPRLKGWLEYLEVSRVVLQSFSRCPITFSHLFRFTQELVLNMKILPLRPALM